MNVLQIRIWGRRCMCTHQVEALFSVKWTSWPPSWKCDINLSIWQFRQISFSSDLKWRSVRLIWRRFPKLEEGGEGEGNFTVYAEIWNISLWDKYRQCRTFLCSVAALRRLRRSWITSMRYADDLMTTSSTGSVTGQLADTISPCCYTITMDNIYFIQLAYKQAGRRRNMCAALCHQYDITYGRLMSPVMWPFNWHRWLPVLKSVSHLVFQIFSFKNYDVIINISECLDQISLWTL